MDEKTVRENLRAYIKRELIRDESYNLTDTEGIITGNLIDSFALAELAVYVEASSTFTSLTRFDRR